MYVDKSIREYLTLVESGEPFPGGGSVSALVASLGASLSLMTSNLSFDKNYFKKLDAEIQEKVKENHRIIQDSIKKLNQYVDEDAEGFAEVIETYEDKSFENQTEKKDELDKKYKQALTAPLKCSRDCVNILRAQAVIVEYGNEETITDVGVGVVLVYAALEGSLMSVKINLKSIDDEKYISKIKKETNNLCHEATSIKNKLRDKVDHILGN